MSNKARILGPSELNTYASVVSFDEKSGSPTNVRAFFAHSHPGLLWQRYLPEHGKGMPNEWRGNNGVVAWYFRAMNEASDGSVTINTNLAEIAGRRKTIIERLGKTICLSVQTQQRCVICAGTSASMENAGLAFHHTYGFPVLPGSSLKGLARHYCQEELGNDTEGLGLEIAEHADLPEATQWFGAGGDESAQEGLIRFYDAWPVLTNACLHEFLDQDVLTVHHKNYYGGSEAVADDTEAPVPVAFLTVNQGVRFEIPLGLTSQAGKLGQETQDQLLVAARALLQEALGFWGIGARTGAGYGRLI
jgi:CRISPR-associated protein Cmr6